MRIETFGGWEGGDGTEEEILEVSFFFPLVEWGYFPSKNVRPAVK